VAINCHSNPIGLHDCSWQGAGPGRAPHWLKLSPSCKALLASQCRYTEELGERYLQIFTHAATGSSMRREFRPAAHRNQLISLALPVRQRAIRADIPCWNGCTGAEKNLDALAAYRVRARLCRPVLSSILHYRNRSRGDNTMVPLE